MGFDLYGLSPNDEVKPDQPNWDDRDQVEAYFAWQDNTPGAHFRANVWTWHPLWDFVYNSCQDIFARHIKENSDFIGINKLYEECTHNNGFIMPKNLSRNIYQRLHNLDQAGILDQSEIEDNIMREKLPSKQCFCCYGKGTRKGWEGWKTKAQWLSSHPTLKEEVNLMDMQPTEDIIEQIARLVDPSNTEQSWKTHPVSVSYKWAHEMKGCNACHGTGQVKSADASYRLDADMLREFSAFSDKSGGFEIW